MASRVPATMLVNKGRNREAVHRGGAVIILLLALSLGGSDSRTSFAGDGLLGPTCCFSRRVGLDVCSPNCPGYLPQRPRLRHRPAGPACNCVPQESCPNCAGKQPVSRDWDAELDGEIAPPSPVDETAPPEPEFEGVAASFGATARTADVVPNMIGDFFGGGNQMFLPSFDSPHLSVMPVGGGDRRVKLSENNSPFPTDRVFLNYNHFHNALRDVNNRELDLDRYTLGIEKTFCDGWWSAELRLPFAYGLDSTQLVGTPSTNSATEFGNLTLILKRAVLRNDRWAIGTGLALVTPTASDAVITGEGNALLVANDAYHLLPFVGVNFSPGERFWTQAFLQADFDANGNAVLFAGPATTPPGIPPGQGEPPVRGVLQDQSLLFMDAAMGYWLFRDPSGCRLISGIAPILELHYSTTMQDGDIIATPRGDAIGGFDLSGEQTAGGPVTSRRLDVLNLTAALRFQIGARSQLTVAGVAPLRSGDDQQFDGEFDLQYVWNY